MLYYLFYPLKELFPPLNLLRYITFRAAGAALTAFIVGMILMPRLIEALKRSRLGERVEKKHSPDLVARHLPKKDTPSMGGLVIYFSVLLATILWGTGNFYVYMGMLAATALAILGFADDYIKLRHPTAHGIMKSTKLLFQCALGIFLGMALYWYSEKYNIPGGTRLVIPFSPWLPALSYSLFLTMVLLVTVGTSNAVNLTDGLDGLAISCTALASMVYLVVAYAAGRVDFSRYLDIPYIPGAGELAIVSSAVIGAGLAFLWYNCYPAQIFMGDTGSLPLGGLIGYIAVVTRHELLLVIVGGVFVANAVSVILQVLSFRLFGKRIFEIAPLHHIFEQRDYVLRKWPETKTSVRFCIIAAILAVFSIATLKLR